MQQFTMAQILAMDLVTAITGHSLCMLFQMYAHMNEPGKEYWLCHYNPVQITNWLLHQSVQHGPDSCHGLGYCMTGIVCVCYHSIS